ncbi:MAG: hypothetical protein KH230_04160 [Enterocloster asparagiformis]|nr:hypothetical protein [Enterocloster asparagiformis]
MKYLVVGPTIINDILFADGSRRDRVLGGSIFCVAGIKLWCDGCLYLSNVGSDFDRFYGDWMKANDCSAEGLRAILPHTWYTTLTYGDQGLHSEVSVYGPEEEALMDKLDAIDPAHIAAHCKEDTRGIYVEASEADPLWDRLNEVRSGGKQARFMWEIPTSAAMESARRPKVLETIGKVDIYSLNLPEAMSLFQVDSEEAAIGAILSLGTPCFFRVGKRGSYMIQNGEACFQPSLTVGPIVDATGCGNVSTAAALYGWCEGLPPRVTARLANISAAYNLLQYGPYPAVTAAVRAEAKALLNEDGTIPGQK